MEAQIGKLMVAVLDDHRLKQYDIISFGADQFISYQVLKVNGNKVLIRRISYGSTNN